MKARFISSVVFLIIYMIFVFMGITIIDNHYFDSFYLLFGFMSIMIGSITFSFIFIIMRERMDKIDLHKWIFFNEEFYPKLTPNQFKQLLRLVDKMTDEIQIRELQDEH